MTRKFLIALTLLAGCTSAAAEDDIERRPIGKADLLGSCEASDCGGPAAVGNCYCDAECTEYGDCCADRIEVCEPEAQVCGGFAGFQCGEGFYCQYAEEATCGFADQTGTCMPTPAGCTEALLPVCGCNGETFANSCKAAKAGVSVAREGACEQEAAECGGHLGLTCAADEFCNFDPGEICGAADHLGTCQVRPETCTAEFAPVCGCDGETYANVCTAQRAGVSWVSQGPCGLIECGGFFDLQCDDQSLACVDNPWDECDPLAGGSDCPGMCAEADE